MEPSIETPDDAWEVEALFDHCFAPGREALSSYRLRDGVAPVADLCRLLRDHGSVVAAIRYWPVRVGDAPALLLGPVAVHPIRQGEGLAGWMIERTLEMAADRWSRAMLVGDAPYYRRHSFERLPDVTMPPPTNPDRVLGRALADGAWHGVAGPVRRWDESPPAPRRHI